MSAEANDSSARERRVDKAVAAYLEAVDAGKTPDQKSSSQNIGTSQTNWRRSSLIATSSSDWLNRIKRHRPSPMSDLLMSLFLRPACRANPHTLPPARPSNRESATSVTTNAGGNRPGRHGGGV